eukprot:4397544-Pyramimonas_sp.AAC.1
MPAHLEEEETNTNETGVQTDPIDDDWHDLQDWQDSGWDSSWDSRWQRTETWHDNWSWYQGGW